MARKTMILLAVLFAACSAFAVPQYQEFAEIALGTNTSGSSTLTLRGYVDTVYVSASDAVSTGTVAISYAPAIGTNAINIATNAVTDEKVWRPVVDRTDIAGVALTNDAPEAFVLVGETLTFSVSGSPTGLTWKCLVVIEDGK